MYVLFWPFFIIFLHPRSIRPVQFMKFTHECFRAVIPKLTKQLKSLQAAKNNNANTVLVFIQEFQSLMTVYEEHALHEDKVVFPAVRRFFPGLNPSMDEEVRKRHAAIFHCGTFLVCKKHICICTCIQQCPSEAHERCCL